MRIRFIKYLTSEGEHILFFNLKSDFKYSPLQESEVLEAVLLTPTFHFYHQKSGYFLLITQISTNKKLFSNTKNYICQSKFNKIMT